MILVKPFVSLNGDSAIDSAREVATHVLPLKPIHFFFSNKIMIDIYIKDCSNRDLM